MSSLASKKNDNLIRSGGSYGYVCLLVCFVWMDNLRCYTPAECCRILHGNNFVVGVGDKASTPRVKVWLAVCSEGSILTLGSWIRYVWQLACVNGREEWLPYVVETLDQLYGKV